METLRLDGRQLRRIEGINAAYRRMGAAPENSSPMVIVDVPVPGMPGYRTRFDDPLAMLAVELAVLRRHLEVEDDFAPTVRVQFGTGLFPPHSGATRSCRMTSFPAARGP